MSKWITSTLVPVAAIAALGLSSAVNAQEAKGYPALIPQPTVSDARIDYAWWDQALDYFVFWMGQSERKGARYVAPELGTRIVYGHDSRLRLEGNRIGFSFLEPDQIAAITAYREDLEATASQVDIASLPRNEQLSFWLNLHNVAVIEQIARAYPVKAPSRMKIGTSGVPLDEAKVVTIRGVALSPRDIRTKIVYPNWKDPSVIYGFFRGEIGGPSVMRSAFTGENVARLLKAAGVEFVNSLRGVERRGRTLHVSTLYAEAAPYFFPAQGEDLQAHLLSYGTEDLKSDITATTLIEPTLSEPAIADLAGGEIDPELVLVNHVTDPKEWGWDVLPGPRRDIGIPRNISRLTRERNEKLDRLVASGQLRGIVTVLEQEPEPGQEVE